MIYFYQILSIILSPFIDIYLVYRKFKKKEDPLRFEERLGISNISRPNGFLVWIHAASVGESKSALTFVNFLLNRYSDINILITSGTVTSAGEISKNLPQRAIHQYVPVDKYYTVKKFLTHWRPNLAIFVESELWPNLVVQTSKLECPLILLNGRISDESFETWDNLRHFGFDLLEKFSLCFAQSQIDKEKFVALGMKNVEFVGNLKAVAEPLKVDDEELKKLKEQIGERPFWLASSTHRGEEEIIIRTHQNLKKYFPNLLTIIAPRHPTRLDEIIKLIPSDIKIAIRSRGETINDKEIYIADTLGELGTLYSLSKISLICGSLIDKIGGHNPFEALQLGSVILSGCYVKNFEETYIDLDNSGSCIVISNEEELLFYVLRLMKDQEYYVSRLKNVTSFETSNKAVLSDIIKIIENNNFLK